MTISDSPDAPLDGSSLGATDVFTGPVAGAVTAFANRDAAGAGETVAWRAPASTRFDGRPANDFLVRAEAIVPMRVRRGPVPAAASLPAGWTTFAIGAGLAVLLGVIVGGLMSV